MGSTEEQPKRCFICSRTRQVGGGQLPRRKISPSVPPAFVDVSINEHLWYFFLLRRVLLFPKQECEKLFRASNGLNPSDWFKVCDKCCDTVNNAFNVYHQIGELERKLEKYQNEVRHNLSRNLTSGRNIGEGGQGTSVRNVIRKYFCSTRVARIEAPVCNITENDDDDFYDEGVQNDDYDDDYMVEGSTPSEINQSLLYVTPNISVRAPVARRSRRFKTKRTYDECVTESNDKDKLRNYDDTTQISYDEQRGSDEDEVLFVENKGENYKPPELTRKKKRIIIKAARGMLLAKSFKCDECEFSTLEIDQKWDHIRKHKIESCTEEISADSEEMKCKLCEDVIPSKDFTVIETHFREKHSSEIGFIKNSCPWCGIRCAKNCLLQFHFDSVHKKVKKFYCEHCGKGYMHRTEFKDHLAIHSNDGKSPFICDFCGLSYKSRSGLGKHCKLFHTGPTEDNPTGSFAKPVECRHCNVQLVHTEALKLHMRSAHCEMFSFFCDMCDASYTNATKLKRHKDCTHSQSRIQCKYCGVEVLCLQYLKDHWRNRCKKFRSEIVISNVTSGVGN